MKKILFILAAIIVLAVSCGPKGDCKEQCDSTKVVTDTTVLVKDTTAVK